METLYKIQPTEIEQLMQEKLADRKINDEFGWTGEWRMSAKNVLDLIIDLNVSHQIEKLEAEKKKLLEALEKATDLLEAGFPEISAVKDFQSLIKKHKS